MSEDPIEPASEVELKRRWKTIRRGMKKRGFDMLLVQANSQPSESIGSLRYLTNHVVSGFHDHPLFPLDGDMAFIGD